ncbi:transglycosylase SLT domain-containing protein, partial [Archangium gephyra]|uniref:transglycosylase SLT domain-containing protein n=1 Tax=Archangium gephyra TaxID=48 RepID=UPI0020110D3A
GSTTTAEDDSINRQYEPSWLGKLADARNRILPCQRDWWNAWLNDNEAAKADAETRANAVRSSFSGITTDVEPSAEDGKKLLHDVLITAKHEWWKARLQLNKARMELMHVKADQLRARGGSTTTTEDDSINRQYDPSWSKLLGGYHDQLLQAIQSGWNALLEGDTAARTKANTQAEELRKKLSGLADPREFEVTEEEKRKMQDVAKQELRRRLKQALQAYWTAWAEDDIAGITQAQKQEQTLKQRATGIFLPTDHELPATELTQLQQQALLTVQRGWWRARLRPDTQAVRRKEAQRQELQSKGVLLTPQQEDSIAKEFEQEWKRAREGWHARRLESERTYWQAWMRDDSSGMAQATTQAQELEKQLEGIVPLMEIDVAFQELATLLHAPLLELRTQWWQAHKNKDEARETALAKKLSELEGKGAFLTPEEEENLRATYGKDLQALREEFDLAVSNYYSALSLLAYTEPTSDTLAGLDKSRQEVERLGAELSSSEKEELKSKHRSSYALPSVLKQARQRQFAILAREGKALTDSITLSELGPAYEYLGQEAQDHGGSAEVIRYYLEFQSALQQMCRYLQDPGAVPAADSDAAQEKMNRLLSEHSDLPYVTEWGPYKTALAALEQGFPAVLQQYWLEKADTDGAAPPEALSRKLDLWQNYVSSTLRDTRYTADSQNQRVLDLKHERWTLLESLDESSDLSSAETRLEEISQQGTEARKQGATLPGDRLLKWEEVERRKIDERYVTAELLRRRLDAQWAGNPSDEVSQRLEHAQRRSHLLRAYVSDRTALDAEVARRWKQEQTPGGGTQPSADTLSKLIVQASEEYLRIDPIIPYKLGGPGNQMTAADYAALVAKGKPPPGIDCSGFVRQLMRRVSSLLKAPAPTLAPGEAACTYLDQKLVAGCPKVPLNEALPGDLIDLWGKHILMVATRTENTNGTISLGVTESSSTGKTSPRGPKSFVITFPAKTRAIGELGVVVDQSVGNGRAYSRTYYRGRAYEVYRPNYWLDTLPIPHTGVTPPPPAHTGTLNAILLEYEPSGASATTARQDKLPAGVGSSHKMADADKPLLRTLADSFLQAARRYGMPPALLAAIASRESRGGALLKNGWGDNGNGYGVMQVDKNYHQPVGEPNSLEHILQATGILHDYHVQVKANHPDWPAVHQLRGALVAYNSGVGNVKTIARMDIGTTGNDYSNDVWARAQRLLPDFSG